MATISELEHRVQLAQDSLSAARDVSSIFLHQHRVQQAEQALRQALIHDEMAGSGSCNCGVCP